MARINLKGTHLVQILTVLGLIWYFQSHKSFLIQIIVADNLFQAINVILNSYQEVPKEFNFFDKYCFYLALSLSASLIDLLTWSYLTIVWQTLVLILSCPYMLEIVFKIEQIEFLIQNLRNKKAQLLHWSLCLIMSKIINSLAIINLNTDPQISHTELQMNFKMGQSTSQIWRFIKIFSINTLVKILAQQDNSYTMWVFKFLYKKGHIVNLPEDNGSFILDNKRLDSCQVLKMVVYNRKWQYLYDPRVLDSLIDLYNQGQTTDYWTHWFNQICNQISLASLKFATIWTICAFFNQPKLLPLVSVIINYHTIEQKSEYLIKALAYVCLWADLINYLWVAFISEYLILLDNQSTRFILATIWSYLFGTQSFQKSRLATYLSHQNGYNKPILSAFICLAITNYFDPFSKYLLVTILVLFSQSVIDYQERFVYSWMVGWGIFSQYNLVHLMLLALILYLVINLMDYQNLPEPLLKLDLYQSYYHTREKTNHANLISSYTKH